jgi:hypothetical protein
MILGYSKDKKCRSMLDDIRGNVREIPLVGIGKASYPYSKESR